jgi:hypothetical protein
LCWDEQFLISTTRLRNWRRLVMPVLFYVLWIAVLTASMTLASDATWKPEYAKNPPAVTAWFKEARVPGGCDNSQKAKAWNRLGICGCCEHADRLKTKFVADAEGEWSYYPNPECTTKECPRKPIPNDIVHQDGIHALNPYDDRLPEFDQMRREGVLFIYEGQPACFWPPEQSDG